MLSKTISVPIKNIHPNPDNPRFEAGDVTALARSISDEDLLSPLLVIPSPDPTQGEGHYMIEDGYRRWVAAKERGRVSLNCTVRYPAPGEDLRVRALITGLITDLHKEHLTAMERAEAYGRLRDEGGMSQGEIAQRLSLNTSTVSRYLSLLELSDKSKDDVRSGKLSVENAITAVKKHRAGQRKKEGKKPVDVGWEPDHFTRNHHLAKKAQTMCDAREHTGRRRYDGVACGQCWETVIRQDQSKVDYQEYKQAVEDAGGQFAVPFLPPLMTAGTSRPNGTRATDEG